MTAAERAQALADISVFAARSRRLELSASEIRDELADLDAAASSARRAGDGAALDRLARRSAVVRHRLTGVTEEIQTLRDLIVARRNRHGIAVRDSSGGSHADSPASAEARRRG